jgi:hypothetical protein
MDILSCKICSNLICRPVSTHCGHNFCLFCMQEHLKTFIDSTPRCFCCNSKIPRKYEINKQIENSLCQLYSSEYESRLKANRIKLSISNFQLWKSSILKTTRVVLILILPFITFAVLSKNISKIPRFLLKLIKLTMKFGTYRSTSILWQLIWAAMHVIVKYIEATSVLYNIAN